MALPVASFELAKTWNLQNWQIVGTSFCSETYTAKLSMPGGVVCVLVEKNAPLSLIYASYS